MEKSSEGQAGLKELKTSTWAAENKQPTRLFLASCFQASVYLLTGTGTNFPSLCDSCKWHTPLWNIMLFQKKK